MSRTDLRAAVIAVAAAVLAAAVPAQGDEQRSLDLQRAQRQLQQSRREAERLFEARLRHDLGLPTDAGAAMPGPAPAAETVDRLQQQWQDEEASTAALLERYRQLRAEVERGRVQPPERDPEPVEMVPVVVPRAGSAVPPASTARPAAAGGSAAAPAGSAPPPALDPIALDPALDPLRAQIHGSHDHRRVAHALFRAGQALAERAAAAREQGELAIAAGLDARAAERLQRALAELEPLLAAKEPPLDALFCQGRCLELLFRHAERHEGLSVQGAARTWQQREQQVRDPWLRIAARDVQRTGARGETEVAGPWARAAQAALEHFRWTNLHGGYDARPTIEALTWPGARPL